jgi:DNA-binding transcriptional MerR regulator
MAHEIAKLLLEKADTFLSRQEAVKSALELGMPLHEIEQYLDWLDLNRSKEGLGSNSRYQRLRNEE